MKAFTQSLQVPRINWGLRKYAGLPPMVFGGDAKCEHEFQIENVDGNPVRFSDKSGLCADGRSESSRQNTVLTAKSKKGGAVHNFKRGFCKCGAWLGDFGLEPTLELYIEHSMQVLDECWRVLRSDGTLWWNLGDSYAGSGSPGGDFRDGKGGDEYLRPYNRGGINLKPLDRCGIPERFVLAAQKRGWYWRDTIIYSKLNPMPESQSSPRWERHRIKVKGMSKTDPRYRAGLSENRAAQSCSIPTATEWRNCPGCPKCLPHGGLVLRWGAWRPTDSYEVIFFLTKTDRYWTDMEAVREKFAENTFERVKYPTGMTGKGIEGRKINGQPQGKEKLHILEQGGRNLRNVWTFPTEPYPEAHFATFPEELPRRCILAGCPEKVCAKCGAGWVRILERANKPNNLYTNSIKPDNINPVGNHSVGMGEKYQNWLNENPAKTLGWKPACKCGTEKTSRGICLDPFAGSGTVVDVALRSGRIGIGVELSPDYIKLAQKRTEASRKQRMLL